MKIKCIIIDDEPIACKGIQEYVEQVDFLELTGVFDNSLQAYAFLNKEPVDLIFLDIEMPRLSGPELLRSVKVAPLAIFITAYPGYAIEGFELGVADYLVKPVAFPRFLKAVDKARDMILVKQMLKKTESVEEQSFFVKEGGNLVKIKYDELLYAEGLQNYVALNLVNRRIISYITLSLLEKQLPGTAFMRVHKSYIVALEKVDTIEGGAACIGKARIPVSRKLKDRLLQKLTENRLLKRR